MPTDPSLPHTTVVLAMSVDGKISDRDRSPARFPSPQDQQHLQARVAEADATLFGAGTLRAYGTTMPVRNPALLAQRQRQGQSVQPVQIVCSMGAQLDPNLRFFTQPGPRWLLTGPVGAALWPLASQTSEPRSEPKFSDVLPWLGEPSTPTNWKAIFARLRKRGIRRLLVMGGGQLVAALAAAHVIDELWLTVCPLLIGGQTAPTPMDGLGFHINAAPRFQLISAESLGDEVFLHYRIRQIDSVP
ncbi:MAG: RibD family protein [Cyanobacteria bacterium J06632_22]